MKNIYIYLLIFFIYSFAGWSVEVLISLIREKRFINRGFLIGPLCPIYGIGGAIITISLNKYANDPLVLFIMSVVICSALEYFTSWLMELIFKNRWWDYSNRKYNLNGRICLEYTVPFGIGSLLVFYIFNPSIYKLLDFFSLFALKLTSISLLCLFVIDFALSFNIILGLKNISNSIICDSTELITKKVKEIIKTKDFLYKRLVDSFPNMMIFNKMYVLKKKMEKNKLKLKKQKKKIAKHKKDMKKKKRK